MPWPYIIIMALGIVGGWFSSDTTYGGRKLRKMIIGGGKGDKRGSSSVSQEERPPPQGMAQGDYGTLVNLDHAIFVRKWLINDGRTMDRWMTVFLMNGVGEKGGNGNNFNNNRNNANTVQNHQLMMNALMNSINVANNGQQQQMMLGELLKKYVENNMELNGSSESGIANNNTARNAGELACAMFMAQMVENAELRQEVQKLRTELDSLKALVAAASVVSNTNNGFGNGNANNGSNGIHYRHHHHLNHQ